MDELRRQVRRAQRRLATQRLVGALGWCWFVGLLAALILIAVDKFHPFGLAAGVLAAGAVGGALAGGFLAALGWAFWTRRAPLEAAIEIDRRYQLKERVSSTLAMAPAARETEAGRALVEDAARRLGRIDVAEKFAVAPSRRLLLPVLPGLAALLVALLVSPAVRSQASANPAAAAQQQDQVKKTVEVLRRKLADRQHKAEQEKLKDASNLLKKLEEATKELAAQPDREKAMVKLNDLSRQIQQRRQALGGAEKIKKQLEQIQKIDQGPADKLAQALERGNFKQAAAELNKLKEQLAGNKLDDNRKQEMAKQLQQMEQKLNQMADAAKTAQGDLQKQMDQLRRDGQGEAADKMAAQLEKLMQEAPQMQQMQELARKLSKCSKCLCKGGKGGKGGQAGKDGQGADAAKAMDELQAGLDQVQKQLDELESLDAAMEQLADARQGMCESKCGGEGGKCQGDKAGQGFRLGEGKGDGKGDFARGKGRAEVPGRGEKQYLAVRLKGLAASGTGPGHRDRPGPRTQRQGASGGRTPAAVRHRPPWLHRSLERTASAAQTQGAGRRVPQSLPRGKIGPTTFLARAWES